MWSVNISVSPCEDAARLGYDDRQINRVVIRMAQYFLDHDMRVIFGHDWREDGVMRAVADFAGTVAARAEQDDALSAEARMLNIVPAPGASLSSAAIEAQRDSGGVLKVIPFSDLARDVAGQLDIEHPASDAGAQELRKWELTVLRHWMTDQLAPGCRVCLGGRLKNYEGEEPGVMQEARLALARHKPLYLMCGFGGAARAFGTEVDSRIRYEATWNGLNDEDKSDLFTTTDIEHAIRLIWRGIGQYQEREANRNLHGAKGLLH